MSKKKTNSSNEKLIGIVTPAQWEILKNRLLETYKEEKDSLRFYFLGANWKRRIEHHGIKESVDTDKPLII